MKDTEPRAIPPIESCELLQALIAIAYRHFGPVRILLELERLEKEAAEKVKDTGMYYPHVGNANVLHRAASHLEYF